MDTSSLRINIIEHIRNSKDDKLISDIARLIKVNDEYDQIIFSDDQRSTIQKAIKQYEQGSYLTGKEAENDIQQWLKD